MYYRTIYYDTLPSSNTEAAILAAAGAEEGTVVVCREQTAGRGQRANKWFTNPCENLTVSLILRPQIASDELFLLSKAFSVAVTNCLQQFGIEAKIKWPNDIYVENRKIAGILIEHSFEGNNLAFTVIGLGLNVKQTQFPPLELVPTSISLETGILYEPDEILSSVLDCFSPLYNSLKIGSRNSVNEKYMEKLFRKTGFFPYKRPCGEIFDAQIFNVADSGELILQTKNGKQEAFRFKEISYINNLM